MYLFAYEVLHHLGMVCYTFKNGEFELLFQVIIMDGNWSNSICGHHESQGVIVTLAIS